QRKKERGTPIHDGFGPNASSMPADDALHICQTNAGALELLRLVQALENAKKFARILHIEADSVIANEDDLFHVALWLTANFNLRARTRSAVFQGVGDQVHHHLPQQRGIS